MGSGPAGGAFELALDGLLLAVVVLHIFCAPYTKVEESFNIQAVHDALFHGRALSQWDHHMFPGSVPRTFLGALGIGAISAPVAWLGVPARSMLVVVRVVLGFFSVAAHARLRSALRRLLGVGAARCLAIIAALQFHLPFYMSRTLPNTFALLFANLAYAELLDGSGYSCLAVLSVAAAVFRCDLLLVIAPVGLLLLAQGRVNFWKAAAATACAAVGGASLSVLIDSQMWGRTLWPEFVVLWFNTAENRSSEWGTSPPAWYFFSALPRALLGALPLVLFGAAVERRVRGYALVALAFVSLYSVLPHKELRFIFPAVPLFNITAAAGAARCLRTKGLWRWMWSLALAGLAVATFAAHIVLGMASSANYPGGVALDGLHGIEPAEPALSVHIGNLAAISGVSRFTERHAQSWRYSKEEGLDRETLCARGFDRLLTEWPEVPGYICSGQAMAYDRLRLEVSPYPWLSISLKPAVFVLARSPDGIATRPCGAEDITWR